jgi:hypothetical protein
MLKEPRDPLAELIAILIIGGITFLIRFATGSISFKKPDTEENIKEDNLKSTIVRAGKEVERTLYEINVFLDANATECRGKALAGASELAKNKESTLYSIREEGMKTNHLALLLITNTLGEQISSGTHHVYRGVLGIIGRDMLKVFQIAVHTMKEKGYYTDQEAEKDMQWVNEQIKKAG